MLLDSLHFLCLKYLYNNLYHVAEEVLNFFQLSKIAMVMILMEIIAER